MTKSFNDEEVRKYREKMFILIEENWEENGRSTTHKEVSEEFEMEEEVAGEILTELVLDNYIQVVGENWEYIPTKYD